MRIVWLCEELGLDHEICKFDSHGDKRMREPGYLGFHPLGRVPSFQDDDVRLFEPGAIIQYILSKYGNGRLVPEEASKEFAMYLQWFHYAEGMLMPPVNTLVVETKILPAEKSSPVHIARAAKLFGKMLGAIDRELSDKDYLAGDFTAADIMCGHACIVAERLGGELSDKPNASAYIQHLLARPALSLSWDAG